MNNDYRTGYKQKTLDELKTLANTLAGRRYLYCKSLIEKREAVLRVYEFIKNVEPVKHGYGYRWRFTWGEPVTKEIRELEKAGVIELKSMAFGQVIFILNRDYKG